MTICGPTRARRACSSSSSALTLFLGFASPSFLQRRKFRVADEQQRGQCHLGRRAAGRADRRRHRHLLRRRRLGRAIPHRAGACTRSAEAIGSSASCSRELSGSRIGCVNAALIAGFRIISIVATIATFNALFGLLMFTTSGKSIYDLPDWWTDRVAVASARRGRSAHAAGRRHGRGDGGDLVPDLAHDDGSPALCLRRQSRRRAARRRRRR